MRSCFISYQREDKAIADRVYLRLRQHGRDVWMDKPPAPFRDSGIPPGADWDDMILDRLQSCYAFLPIFSARPVPEESYFAKELALAIQANASGTAAHVVLPVLSGIETIPALPGGASFAMFQWVDLLEEGLGQVARVLEPLLEDGEVMHDRISIASLGDFIAAIGPNRTLTLTGPDIDLTLKDNLPSGLAYVSAEDVFDGRQLTIHDVENLTIEAPHDTRTHAFVSPRYAFPLDFFDCTNVRLQGLRLGHHPDLGECAGGVVRARRCANLTVSDTQLYGCGTMGFEMSGCNRVFVDECTIEHCTQALASFNDCESVAIRDTVFRQNDATGGISFQDCRNVEVTDTIFRDNTQQRFGQDTPLIRSSRSSEVWFRNCRAWNNAYTRLEANAGSARFTGCTWEGLAE